MERKLQVKGDEIFKEENKKRRTLERGREMGEGKGGRKGVRKNEDEGTKGQGEEKGVR